MAPRTIDDIDSSKPSQRSHSRAIDEEETLRIIDEERNEDDLGLDDDTDPGDRRRDPLRQPL